MIPLSRLLLLRNEKNSWCVIKKLQLYFSHDILTTSQNTYWGAEIYKQTGNILQDGICHPVHPARSCFFSLLPDVLKEICTNSVGCSSAEWNDFEKHLDQPHSKITSDSSFCCRTRRQPMVAVNRKISLYNKQEKMQSAQRQWARRFSSHCIFTCNCILSFAIRWEPFTVCCHWRYSCSAGK